MYKKSRKRHGALKTKLPGQLAAAPVTSNASNNLRMKLTCAWRQKVGEPLAGRPAYKKAKRLTLARHPVRWGSFLDRVASQELPLSRGMGARKCRSWAEREYPPFDTG